MTRARPIHRQQLPIIRTEKKPGDVEIVFRGGTWKLHYYGRTQG